MWPEGQVWKPGPSYPVTVAASPPGCGLSWIWVGGCGSERRFGGLNSGVGGGCGCVGGRFFHGFGEAEADLSAAERGLAEADGAVVIFHGGADDVEADAAAARFGGIERGFIFFNAGPAGAAVVDDEDDGFLPGDDIEGDFADFAIGFGDGFGAVAEEVGEGELELGVIALDAAGFGGVLVADVDAVLFQGAFDLEHGAFDDLSEVDRFGGCLHVAQEDLHFLNGTDDALGFGGDGAQYFAGFAAVAQRHVALEEDGAERLVDFVGDGGGGQAAAQFRLEFDPLFLF